ncbi:MAG: lamin tail domain-containing protein, partial [Candidatus Thermoplasmatota archaeon]
MSSIEMKLSNHIFIVIVIFLILNLTLLSNPKIQADPPEIKILINEVMYNPYIDDDYYEWIELYNPTPYHINLSWWTITDNNSNDTITGDNIHGNGTTIIPPYSYAILTDNDTRIYDNTTITAETIKLKVNSKAIGNGLGNNGDKIILKDKLTVIIDAIEWGIDYDDVPGYPTELIPEGHTLSRYPYIDTDNTSNDFYDESKPTIGYVNHYNTTPKPNIYIEHNPLYIPKTTQNNKYSQSFIIKPRIENLKPDSKIQIKAYIVGETNHTYPASQIYHNDKWEYSYYYQDVKTNQDGCYTEWLHLRFNSEYQEYQRSIKNNDTAYIVLKVKVDSVIYKYTKKVKLLDLDDSTSNGTKAGYIVGIAKTNTSILENTLVIVKDKNQNITSISLTEDNHINEGLITEPGYYKIPVPTGSNYTLQFLDKNNNNSIIHEITNITVKKGVYNVELKTTSTYHTITKNHDLKTNIKIRNNGDFNDTFNVYIDNKTSQWAASINTNNIYLKTNETENLTLQIIPYPTDRYGYINIKAVSDTDHGATNTITINIEVLAPDLIVTNIKCTDKDNNQNDAYGEGYTIKIKATIKNQGPLNATNITVGFYYDHKDPRYCIGKVKYELIGKYQKYPSVEWDTSNIKTGTHNIIVVADEEDKADEYNETNNIHTKNITIHDTRTPGSDKIKITEIYYHTHPRIKNEYIKIHNPTDKNLNISGWYLTNTPNKRIDKQTRITYPPGTIIKPGSSIIATQNASAYIYETGYLPDFEYNTDSRSDIPQLISPKNFTMSNKAGVIALKDQWNHTIDMVVYGETNYTNKNWISKPIKNTGEGAILKRVFINNKPVDTDTYKDWINNRRYGIGQSDFPIIRYSVDNGSIICFASPDTSFNTIREEIRKAEKSIILNMYEFTHPAICDDIIEALNRNISVKILIEGGPIGGIDDREKMILYSIHINGGEIRFMVNKPSSN